MLVQSHTPQPQNTYWFLDLTLQGSLIFDFDFYLVFRLAYRKTLPLTSGCSICSAVHCTVVYVFTDTNKDRLIIFYNKTNNKFDFFQMIVLLQFVPGY